MTTSTTVFKTSSCSSCYQCDSMRCFGKRYKQVDKSVYCSKCLFINNDPKNKVEQDIRVCTESCEGGTLILSSQITLDSTTETGKDCRDNSNKNKNEIKRQRLNHKSSSDMEIVTRRNSLLQSFYDCRFDKSNPHKRRTGENSTKTGREFVKKLGVAVKEKYDKEKVFEEITHILSKPNASSVSISYDTCQNIGDNENETNKLMSKLVKVYKSCSCKVCECIDDIMSVPQTGLVHSDPYKLVKKQLRNTQFATKVNKKYALNEKENNDVEKREITFQKQKTKTLTPQDQMCSYGGLRQNVANRVASIKDIVKGCESEIATFIVVPKKAIRWNICKSKVLKQYCDISQDGYNDQFTRSYAKPINKNYPWNYESKDVILSDQPSDSDLKVTTKQDSKKTNPEETSKSHELEIEIPYTKGSINSLDASKLILEAEDVSKKLKMITQNLDKAFKRLDLVTEKWQSYIQQQTTSILHNAKEKNHKKIIRVKNFTDPIPDAIKDQYKVISDSDTVLKSEGDNLIKDKIKNHNKEMKSDIIEKNVADEVDNYILKKFNDPKLKERSYKYKKNKNIETMTNGTSTSDEQESDSDTHEDLKKEILKIKRILFNRQRLNNANKSKQKNSSSVIKNTSTIDVEERHSELSKDLDKLISSLQIILSNKQKLNSDTKLKQKTEQTVSKDTSITDEKNRGSESSEKFNDSELILDLKRFLFRDQDSLSHSSVDPLHASKSLELELVVSDKDHNKVSSINSVPNSFNTKHQAMIESDALTPHAYDLMEEKGNNRRKNNNTEVIQAIITGDINNPLKKNLNEIELKRGLFTKYKELVKNFKKYQENRTANNESKVFDLLKKDSESLGDVSKRILNLERILLNNQSLSSMSHPSSDLLYVSELEEPSLGTPELEKTIPKPKNDNISSKNSETKGFGASQPEETILKTENGHILSKHSETKELGVSGRGKTIPRTGNYHIFSKHSETKELEVSETRKPMSKTENDHIFSKYSETKESGVSKRGKTMSKTENDHIFVKNSESEELEVTELGKTTSKTENNLNFSKHSETKGLGVSEQRKPMSKTENDQIFSKHSETKESGELKRGKTMSKTENDHIFVKHSGSKELEVTELGKITSKPENYFNFSKHSEIKESEVSKRGKTMSKTENDHIFVKHSESKELKVTELGKTTSKTENYFNFSKHSETKGLGVSELGKTISKTKIDLTSSKHSETRVSVLGKPISKSENVHISSKHSETKGQGVSELGKSISKTILETKDITLFELADLMKELGEDFYEIQLEIE